MNIQVVNNMDVIVDELKEWDQTKNIKKDSMRIMCDEPPSEAGKEVRQAGREFR